MNTKLEALTEPALSEFFTYLEAHLQENGANGAPLFQPQSRSDKRSPPDKQAAFKEGLGIPVGTARWRRAWIYRDVFGRIAGHVDLRGRPEPFTSHRALLGIGLERALRGQGLGIAMIDYVSCWARNTGIIEIIDLDLLAQNTPALKLYQAAGFEFVARIEDLFRIDGVSEAQIVMTKRL